MLFNTFSYLLFLLLIVGLYWCLPEKLKVPVLLLASFYFYGCYDVRYILFLLFSIISTYIAGLFISNPVRTDPFRKLVLGLTITANLLFLLCFKYLNFFLSSVQVLVNAFKLPFALPTELSLLLPIGISFYTFQVIGYMIDVYRKDIPPCRNLLDYALYVSFFPKISQGPIENSRNFLVQIQEGTTFDYEQMRDGFYLILSGLLKKVVIADRIALFVNAVYGDLDSYGGLTYIVAAVFYAIQIYCDFSGYTNIALGSAKLMGFDLLNNFNYPYFATSIQDFWRRWHISLTKWFTAYVYIPLGGSRKGQKRWIFNVLVVFLLSGLWHGANWTFCVWGLIHAIYQIAGKLSRPYKNKVFSILHLSRDSHLYQAGSVLCTFIWTALAWVFFRAETLKDAAYVIGGMFSLHIKNDLFTIGFEKNDFILAIILIILLFIAEYLHQKKNLYEILKRQILPLRWGTYILILMFIIMFGVYGDLSAASFIYFQF